MVNSWNEYAKTWEERKEKGLLKSENKQSGIHDIGILGDEWGDAQSVNEVIDDFILPFINEQSLVLEIGSGGGRISRRVADCCRKLYCADVSLEMLKETQKTCKKFSNISYTQVDGRHLKKFYEGITFDFIYTFDVFVHLRIESIFRYLEEITELLGNKGKAFIHTTNIGTDDGYNCFMGQVRHNSANTFGSLKFVSPEAILSLARRVGLRLIKQNEINGSNFYYRRDNLMVFEKQS